MIDIGASFGDQRTLTEEDLELAIRLTGGRHPVHTDAQRARQAGFRERIFHGAVTAAIMTAAIGRRFPDVLISIAEQRNVYCSPVYPGDTLESRWTVREVLPGRRTGQTRLRVEGDLTNQHGQRVMEAEARLVMWTRGEQNDQ